MSVKRIMSKNVTTVDPYDSLRIVKEIFDSTRFHHLLVVESEKLLGVVSDRDLLKVLSPSVGTLRETAKDAASLNKKVHQIMTRKLIVLEEDASIYDAVRVFNNHNISCIPIVDEEQMLAGILSWRDILKEIEKKRDQHPSKGNQ